MYKQKMQKLRQNNTIDSKFWIPAFAGMTDVDVCFVQTTPLCQQTQLIVHSSADVLKKQLYCFNQSTLNTIMELA